MVSRLFLIDDHPRLREGLRQFIERQTDLTVIGESDNGQLACQEVNALLPDLVLVDFAMKGLDGIQTTQRITKECPQVKVLAFTMHVSKVHLSEMFGAGASGFVAKSSSADILLKAIRAILSGQSFIDPDLGLSSADLLPRATTSAELPRQPVSEREQAVLMKLAKGYSNREIAAQLDLGIASVEACRARAMKKLALESRVELLRYATGQNWLSALSDENSPSS